MVIIMEIIITVIVMNSIPRLILLLTVFMRHIVQVTILQDRTPAIKKGYLLAI